MLFYKYTYTYNGKSEERGNGVEKKEFTICTTLKEEAILCKEFSEKLEKTTFYIVDKNKTSISFICVYGGPIKDLHTIDKSADELILHLNLEMVLAMKVELSLSNLIYELDVAERNEFIKNSRDVIEIHDLRISGGNWFKEKLFKFDQSSKEDLIKDSSELVIDDELKNELERIYQPSIDNDFGVPVHYFLNIANDMECSKAVRILLDALKNNNRVIRNFYTIVDFSFKNRLAGLNAFDIQKLFKINMGGVVVIYANYQLSDDMFSEEHMITELFANGILKNANNVTTIICCKHKSQENKFTTILKDLLLVEINDSTIKNLKAKQYLENYAQKLNIKSTTGLVEMVEEDVSYKPDDLIIIFNKWHKNYVKTIQYPQYATLVNKEIKADVNSEKKVALNELHEMVGLEEIKKTIDNYINYAKLQKACVENGVIAKNTCKHMCFVGNPGTAKTTVARYVAQVMKEQGLISKGKLIEVGRSDIVSRYIGGTAPNVKAIFEKAIGNVLFIDEAYSLCDGKEGMYGDEAINAIVQEMENKREDVIVIFAGYKNEMQKFLSKNSGLKSRIASIIEFSDYTEAELLSIAQYQADKMGIDISRCEEVIKNLICVGKEKEQYFGNGRFVRNLLEKARMNQASRLISEDKLFGENLKILKPEDFEVPEYEKTIKMGFC